MQQTISRPILFIVIAAFFLRLLLVAVVVYFLGEKFLLLGDASRFKQIAEALLMGHGFTLGSSPFLPSAFFPPVLLLLFAGSLKISGSILPLVVLHSALASLIPLLVWKISGFLTDSRRVRTWAALLSAFEPQMILWSLAPLTEPVAVFMMLCGVYFFFSFLELEKKGSIILSGIFLGISTLTRPHGQFLFILGAVLLVAIGIKKWKRGVALRAYMFSTALFVLFFVIVLSPWLIRNHIQFGSWGVATTGLRNIYSDYAVSVISFETGAPFGETRRKLYEDLSQKYRVSAKQIREDPRLGGVVAGEGFKIIAAHPLSSAKVLAISLNAFFTQDLYAIYLRHFMIISRFETDFSPSVVLLKQGPIVLMQKIWQGLGLVAAIPIAARIFWILLDAGAAFGAWRAYQGGGVMRRTALCMVAIILYYAATSSIGAFGDQGRFRYAINPFLFILGAYGAARLLRMYNSVVASRE